MSRKPDPLDHLADALAEDILAAPAERIIAEAAEDAGDARAVAAAFDRVAARAIRQSRRRRFAERVRALAAALDPRASWRPAMAAAAGIAVIVVAGDLYLHVRPDEPKLARAPAPEPAPAPEILSKSELSSNLAPADESQPASKTLSQAPRDAIATQPPAAFGNNRINDRVADTGQSAAPPAPAAAPAPPAAETALPRTLAPGGAGAHTAARMPAQTAVGPQRPMSDDRLRAILGGEPKSSRADAEKAKREASQPSPGLSAGAIRMQSNAPSFRWPLRGEAQAVLDGIDVAVPVGTDIRAAASGTVTYARELQGYGNVVVLSHQHGFRTIYAHMSEILVKPGEQVESGQVIAKSGRSSDADVPKLHFEIRKDAAPVDPVQFLPPP